MKHYHKLVRDYIPTIIRQDGKHAVTCVLSPEAYQYALFDKLREEAQEVADAAPDAIALELADVYEVIDAIMTAWEIDSETVRIIQAQRRQERGAFYERIFLVGIEDSNEQTPQRHP